MKSDLITVVIYSHNSESDIKDCIRSASKLTQKIIVIDLTSADQTVKIAKSQGVEIIKHPFVTIVEEVREFGIAQVKTPWVFVLDADERLTPELIDEIKTLPLNGPFTHYRIPRKEIFASRTWLQHGGWWPNYQPRFFMKSSLASWPAVIHTSPKFTGQLGYVKSAFLHYSQNDWSEIVEKTIRFEGTEAQLLYDAHKPVSTPTFFRKYFGELFRRLIKNQGFKDGQIGIIESLYQAFSKTITYLFLYEKRKKSD